VKKFSNLERFDFSIFVPGYNNSPPIDEVAGLDFIYSVFYIGAIKIPQKPPVHGARYQDGEVVPMLILFQHNIGDEY